MRQGFRVKGLAGAAAVVLASAVLTTSSGAAVALQPDRKPTFTWQNHTWNRVTADPNPANPERAAYFLESNVKKRGADLVISTRRHCTTGRPTPKNATEQKCKNQQETKYSSGRAQLPSQLANTPRFTVSFRAKLPTRSAQGARQALWITNTLYDCAVGHWGEFDNLEWYSNRPATGVQTAHMGCAGGQTIQKGARPGFSAGRFHTWKVVRRFNVVRFFRDKQQVQKVVCGRGRFKNVDCSAILNSPYTVIIQGEVFNGPVSTTNPIFEGPDWKKGFPVQKMVVRDLRISAP